MPNSLAERGLARVKPPFPQLTISGVKVFSKYKGTSLGQYLSVKFQREEWFRATIQPP
jgi:hypothetical protein